ncbi:MAG: ABC-F type ribosomal protection protein [Lachnospiraceae bacterium]|nr:ABC-F type ribosomal protection protein [Lachnospiraceae bacterium]
MALIKVNQLTFCYEGSFDNIFENISFSIDTNWKLGFIGRNGKGKTTFLKLLLGKYDYQGSIDTSTTFGYFPYRITENQMQFPAVDFMEELKTGCEAWRVICELGGMGETAEILYRPFGTLSPGERTKVLLAVLFSGENEFLLIDEPTNHLDCEARESVKRYLESKKGFILVSHDRDLLDACTDHCLVLNRSSIEVQSGNFSVWWENKQRKDQFAIAENEKHLKEIQSLKRASARTLAWADQNERTKIGFDPIKEHDRSKDTRSYIGAKTKKMQSRVKQLEKRISREIEEKEGLLQDIETTVDLKLIQLSHHKNTLVRVRDYGLSYGNNPVFDGLSFTVEQGDRIALSGKNGSGKSSLIKMILQKSKDWDQGPEVTEEGLCETASGLVISYVGQDASGLKGDIGTYCRERGLDISLFCAILRQLDFERVQFLKNMEDFSEGQKKKVLLATSLLTPAHLYIWDEPLNYIDLFSRMQIEKLLLEYRPTMLFVEHDVRFAEKIATKTIGLHSSALYKKEEI